MNLHSFLKIALTAGALCTSSVVVSADWSGKYVEHLQSSGTGGDCIYFTLGGVAQADPVAPGNPWFAIRRTQYGAKDAYAMLLSVKLIGQTVNISTDGTLSCGYATASAVWMP